MPQFPDGGHAARFLLLIQFLPVTGVDSGAMFFFHCWDWASALAASIFGSIGGFANSQTKYRKVDRKQGAYAKVDCVWVSMIYAQEL